MGGKEAGEGGKEGKGRGLAQFHTYTYLLLGVEDAVRGGHAWRMAVLAPVICEEGGDDESDDDASLRVRAWGGGGK